MMTNNHCSLKFPTKQELNVHTITCREKMLESSSLKSQTCEHCNSSFMTAAKLAAHDDMCEDKYRAWVTSIHDSLNNQVNEFGKTLIEWDTHVKEPLCTFVGATWANGQFPMISLPSTSSETLSNIMLKSTDFVRVLHNAWMLPPSLSKLSKSKQKFPRKRFLDTETDSASESSSEPSSPLLKISRSNDEDETD